MMEFESILINFDVKIIYLLNKYFPFILNF